MITTSNLKDMLSAIGFTTSGDKCEKKFDDLDTSLSVDFNDKILIYPSEIKGGDRNNGFDKNENFVVFECVNKLLEKGYRPEHIELEKEWHLGHDSKSGRADILVTNENGSTLFIIECKTWGREFDKALNDTKNDGGQLFSYWQQEQSCKWLVLYASDFKDGNVDYKAPTIDCSDDANFLLLAKKDENIKLYRDAHTTPERYEAWKETYKNQIHDDLVFSEDSVAYKIGIKPLRKKNLRDFSPDDKIVNKFEEILRHNNVSDKENAFNRLIALFICKLVDESTKNEEDEVEFQYKQGTDNYETLQDRLQRLHRDGMEKFMREEIYYVSADYSERLFANYTGNKRKKAIEDLQKTIRILKFYSNNDFAFKDVHNEELFYQNGKILVEMVQLFEKYRIVYPSKHQFLGDLFEQLLNKGFKQNEGQFFTPMPITRFIWDSLPIKRMVKSDRGTVYPKIIDYACGAGHFLTEAVEAINYFTESDDNSWVRDHIFGIEKDYRLARVAKISLFMNGAGEGNIIFGDGLENAPDKGIENGSFDILVANPPYAVKDFKQHLQLKNNSFELLERIGLNGGEIETLFIERIGQLLKPKGVAAVILPNSILSNDSTSYTGAREHILKNFYIRAIVAFGSKTFGETGTSTVVLFLEKFNEPPKKADLSADSISAIFSGEDLTEWQDQEILSAYISQIEVDEQAYLKYLHKQYSLEELTDVDYFKIYAMTFSGSSVAKNLQKKKTFRSKPVEEQKAIYLEFLYTYINSIEIEKLFYFSLVYRQKTVIIKAPNDIKEQKKFLGYDWCKRKGNEGIQVNTPGGRLYNDSDRTAEGTLASAIRQSFGDVVPEFSEDQTDIGYIVDTKDMLDYSRVGFNKAIRLNFEKATEFKSKYSMRDLGEVAIITAGQSPKSEFYNDQGEGLPFYQGKKNFGTKSLLNPSVWTSKITKESVLDDILMSVRAPVGDVNINPFERICIGRGLAAIRAKTDKISQEYLYYFLLVNKKNISGHDGLAFASISANEVKTIKIPLPPVDIQSKIITECKKIDEERDNARETIKECHKKIDALFAGLETTANEEGRKLSLADVEKFDVLIGRRILNKDLVENGEIPVYSANVFEVFGYVDDLLITDFSLDSVLWGIDGDWLVNVMPKEKQFCPTDHCGVLRSKTDEINPRYLAHVLKSEGQKMGFSRNHRASIDRIKSISFYVPNIEKQDEVIEKVVKLEAKITEAEKDLESLQGKTAEILKKYLQ